MILFKWVERGLGLISTLILVRLLTPADFGMVAMALSFIFMAEIVTAFAFDIALIHDRSAGIDHFNSAWTANLLLGSAVALAMWVSAYPISLFYGEPALTVLICVLALGPVATGFENIGVVAFRRELDFRKEFVFQVSRKVMSFCVAIPLAFAFRSYWALVFGTLAAKVGGTALSYWVHPFRPRISFKELGSLVRFSRWLLLNNFVNFLKERSTDFFIGRIHGPSSLGIFNITYEFANLPTFEIGAPVNRALLPGFASLQDDAQSLQASFRNAVSLVGVIAVPVGTGLFAIAPMMVPVVLGEDWLAAVGVMEVLSLNSTILVFHGTIVTMFIAVGHPELATRTNLYYVLVLLAGLTLLTGGYGSLGAAYSTLIACIVSTPVFLFQVRRRVGIPLRAFFGAVIRPAIAATAMVLLVRAILPAYTIGTPAGEGIRILLSAIFAGAATYVSCLGLIWLALGRPEGAESIMWSKLKLRYDVIIARVRDKSGVSE